MRATTGSKAISLATMSIRTVQTSPRRKHLLCRPHLLVVESRALLDELHINSAVEAWCQRLLEFKPRVDFDPGARGWCYLLEAHGLSKGDFDRAERLISECRKNGLLPLDFTTDDIPRDFDHVEEIDDRTPEERAAAVVSYVSHAQLAYDPVSFWEFQNNYVEMLVEKAALQAVCSIRYARRYHVPIGNAAAPGRSTCDANLLARFARWQEAGNDCVLLYCGDHDPHGLRISSALAIQPRRRACRVQGNLPAI